MITGKRPSTCRNFRNVSSPFMPAPMRTSMITKSGLTPRTRSSPSSPLEAVCNSIRGDAKIRRNEYCTSVSSSISRILSLNARAEPKVYRTYRPSPKISPNRTLEINPWRNWLHTHPCCRNTCFQNSSSSIRPRHSPAGSSERHPKVCHPPAVAFPKPGTPL